MIPIAPVRRLFGVPVQAATMTQVVAACQTAVEARRGLTIGVVNAAKIVKMRHDPLLHNAVCGSDLILADGMAVVWASRLLGRPLPERVAGIDLFERLLELAGAHHYSVYFLGATQAVLDTMLDQVRRRFPGLRVAGCRNGYFSDDQSASVAAEIRGSAPDFLFVAMTSPKKEVFLARWGGDLNIGVCHGVGGSFDVLAGAVKRAPRRWQQLGLEWLYRVRQEPRRMWRRYLVTNTLFIALVVRELLRRPSTPDLEISR